MLMKNRRILAIIMVIAISICAVGCGGASKNTVKGSTGKKPAGAQTDYFDDVPAELDGTTVKFATWIDHNSNESAQVLADFTDITGINVELVSVSQMDYITKLSGLIASGDAPDVIVCNSEWPRILSLLTPLDETKIDTKDTFWNQDVIANYTVGGKPYLVNVKGGAWDMASGCVVYNNRIFEDNGITTPALYLQEGRWTLDNFFKAAQELKSVCKEAGVGIATGTYLTAYADGFATWDAANGKFVSNIKNTDFINAWQKLVSARDAGYAKVNDDGARYLFENESMGMVLTGSYGLRKSGWFQAMDIDDLGFIELPRVDANGEEVYSATSDRGYGICKGAKNPDGAAYFLRYFLDANNYDPDELYKNEECAELYKKLQNTNKNMGCSAAIFSILGTSDKPMYDIFPDLKNCTASQIQTALASGENTFNACIERANAMIEGAKSENQ